MDEENVVPKSISPLLLTQDDVILLVRKAFTNSRRPPNDPYFAAVNTLVGLDSVPGLRRLGVLSTIDDDLADGSGAPLLANANDTLCNVPGCNRQFNSMLAYDRHYSSSHRYQCAQCHRMLPSAHLLDLHLTEQHDSFFAAQLAARRDRPWFACYLKECTSLSVTPDERKDHCIRAHSFPANFRFETSKPAASGQASSSQQDGNLTKGSDGDKLPHSKGPIQLVNFGHSKQKAFATASSFAEEDYAKILTKGLRNKVGLCNNKSAEASSGNSSSNSSLLESTERLTSDLMDCLDNP